MEKRLGIANQADFTLVVSGVEKNLLELEGIKSTVSVVTNIHSLEMPLLIFEKRSRHNVHRRILCILRMKMPCCGLLKKYGQ